MEYIIWTINLCRFYFRDASRKLYLTSGLYFWVLWLLHQIHFQRIGDEWQTTLGWALYLSFLIQKVAGDQNLGSIKNHSFDIVITTISIMDISILDFNSNIFIHNAPWMSWSRCIPQRLHHLVFQNYIKKKKQS